MGRNRKFKLGDIVRFREYAGEDIWIPAVVVDYQQDESGHSRYRIVRLIYRSATLAYGPSLWVETYMLKPTSGRAPNVVTSYAKNKMIPDRGCRCHCCIHVKQSPSMVNRDGTYVGDE